MKKDFLFYMPKVNGEFYAPYHYWCPNKDTLLWLIAKHKGIAFDPSDPGQFKKVKIRLKKEGVSVVKVKIVEVK